MPPIHRIPGTGEAAPPRPERAGGPPPASTERAGALRSRQPPPAPARGGAGAEETAVEALAGVVGSTGGSARPAAPVRGLAERMLDFIAPRLSGEAAAALMPGRLDALLEGAAARLETAAPSDEIARTGAAALRQELELHRALAAVPRAEEE